MGDTAPDPREPRLSSNGRFTVTSKGPDYAGKVLADHDEALARIAVLEAVLTNTMDRLIEIHENEALPMAIRQIAADLDDAIVTTLAAVPMTLGENFDQSGRVEIGADDPLAKALQPSPETIAEIERIERGNR